MEIENLEPKGIRFIDKNQGEMILVSEGEYEGWLCYRHPDGQWVSLRKATEDDIKKVGEMTWT